MSEDSSIDSTVESSAPSSPSTLRASLDEFYQTATYNVLNSQSTGSLDGVFHMRREVRQEPRGATPVASAPPTITEEFHTQAPDIDHSASVTNTMAAYLREVDERAHTLIQIQADPRALLYKTILSMHDRLYTFIVNPDLAPHERNRIQDVLRKYNVPSVIVPRWQVLKDLVVDDSMTNAITDLSRHLSQPTDQPEFMGLVTKYKSLIDLYKTYGDELLRADADLTEITNRLEELHKRSNFIMGLHPNQDLDALFESYMKYINTESARMNLETKYLAVVEAYKRWTLTRTLIKAVRTAVAVTDTATDSERAGPTCSICMTNEVNHVSVPCGHTMCSHCISRMNHLCYICRTPIKQKLKLYF